MHAKKKKYTMPIFQNIIETVRKQVILLIISNGERWHYLEVKIYQHYLEEQCQSTWITFIVLIAFTFFVTENKNDLHKKVCKNKTFVKLQCLLYRRKYHSLINTQNLIKCLKQKTDKCKNNPENS